MSDNSQKAFDPAREESPALVVDALRRIVAHYGLWLCETDHQLGLEAALKAEKEAGDRLIPILFKRLSKALGIELENGLPKALYDLDNESLNTLMRELSLCWLAADGVWFQAVEKMGGMHDAKRVNDTCWTRFSPYEAARIMDLAGIEPGSGLDGLKKVLGLRLYSRINVQEIGEETNNSFLFRMLDCRVQSARKRKGLEDYPCKSGGMVEYVNLARAVDPRIRVECVHCPPDDHPEDCYCAWRFSI